MERASSQQVAIAVAAAVGAASALFLWLRSRRIAEARHELLALAETPTKTAPDSSDTPTKEPPSDVHILHSGGFASEVASMLSSSISDRSSSCACHIHSMEKFKKWQADLALTDRSTPLFVVFIVSTIENEQPPEEAQPCVLWQKRRGHPPDLLRGKCRSRSRLGDNLLLDRQTTTAKDCNQVATRLDSRLAALGAERCYTVGQVDDRTGNQELVPWLDAFVASLF